MVNLVTEVTPKMKSRFGTVHISLTPEVLEDLKHGKKVVADIFEEYTVVISVGDDLSTEEKC